MEMKLETKVMASESSHFYDRDGTPCYEVKAKDGSMRPSTLRDCRKHGWVPSVTTILGVIAKPGLENWKMQNIVLAAMTLPRMEGESLDAFSLRVIQDGKETGRKAAQLGTDIHASLDKAYSGKDYNPEHEVYVKAVQEAVFLRYGNQDWIAEKSFAHGLGFGGKIDLACEVAMIEGKTLEQSNTGIVIDFKTSSFTEDKVKTLGYDEHVWQLSAYATGLCIQKPILANVYVSTVTPGLVCIKEYTAEEAAWGWDCFSSFLNAWKIMKKYQP
jgi:hypothetical protein